MDLLEKITQELEPLGGELLTDQFLQARHVPETPPASRTRTAAAPGAAAARPRAETVRVATLRPDPGDEPESDTASVSDTGKLRLEVQEFLNRDEAEGTDDREVEEFLHEKKGFDPTELE